MLQDYYTFGTPAFGRVCVVIALAFLGMAVISSGPSATIAVIMSAMYAGLAVYNLTR